MTTYRSFTPHEDRIIRAGWDSGKTDAEVAAQLPGRTKGAVCDRRKQLGMTRTTAIPMPADYLAYRACHMQTEAARKFGVSVCTASLWDKRHGVRGFRPARNTVRMADLKAHRSAIPPIAGTRAASAAHYLRRYFASVHSCDIKVLENGKTWAQLRDLPKGLYFVAGHAPMDVQDMMDMASARGWMPERLAA